MIFKIDGHILHSHHDLIGPSQCGLDHIKLFCYTTQDFHFLSSLNSHFLVQDSGSHGACTILRVI